MSKETKGHPEARDMMHREGYNITSVMLLQTQIIKLNVVMQKR